MHQRDNHRITTKSRLGHGACSATALGSQERSNLGSDTRGAVLIEYIVVLAFAGILVTLGLLTVGPRTVENYSGQRGALYQNSP